MTWLQELSSLSEAKAGWAHNRIPKLKAPQLEAALVRDTHVFRLKIGIGPGDGNFPRRYRLS